MISPGTPLADIAAMRRVVITGVLLACGLFVAVTFAATPPPLPPRPEPLIAPTPKRHPSSVLDKQLLVTWYGSPWTGRMGILGRLQGKALADGLKQQAAAYAKASGKPVLPAYELIATVAQPLPCREVALEMDSMAGILPRG